MKLDTQQTEMLGRVRVTDALVRAGIEVATPIRDRGVDLIAYFDRSDAPGDRFRAVPIQLKIATNKSFSINRKYERVSNLLIVYVWHVALPQSRFFALRYEQVLALADRLEWTATKSWTDKDGYSVSTVSSEIETLLDPFEVKSPEQWRKLIADSEA